MGFPELGYVSIAELVSVTIPPFGAGIERDLYFEADKPISEYMESAKAAGFVVA